MSQKKTKLNTIIEEIKVLTENIIIKMSKDPATFLVEELNHLECLYTNLKDSFPDTEKKLNFYQRKIAELNHFNEMALTIAKCNHKATAKELLKISEEIKRNHKYMAETRKKSNFVNII